MFKKIKLITTSLLLLALVSGCKTVSVEVAGPFVQSFECHASDWKTLRSYLKSIKDSEGIVSVRSADYLLWATLNERLVKYCPNALLEKCANDAPPAKPDWRYATLEGPIQSLGMRVTSIQGNSGEQEGQSYLIELVNVARLQQALTCFDSYFALQP